MPGEGEATGAAVAGIPRKEVIGRANPPPSRALREVGARDIMVRVMGACGWGIPSGRSTRARFLASQPYINCAVFLTSENYGWNRAG
jgi:hypothetical protein